jgi:hypothetical protein
MILLGFRKIESATVAQTAETPIMAVRAHVDVFRRNIQLRQNLADNADLAEDALVCEKREFAALRVVGNATPWEFLILAVGNLSALGEFSPEINVAALVNSEVAITTCLGERC